MERGELCEVVEQEELKRRSNDVKKGTGGTLTFWPLRLLAGCLPKKRGAGIKASATLG